jgi:V8-like Glu-specific endopeptidase
MGARRHLRSLAVAASAACLAALAASPPVQGATTWTRSPAAVSARQALRFWTPARMRRARPLDASPSQVRGLARGSTARSDDSEGRGLEADAEARSEFAAVADPTAPGFRQNGVIFVVLPGSSGLARCSGTSVNAANLSVVFTAGHCVNEGNARRWFDRDWVFVPGYHNGVRPFGVFVAKWLGATAHWVNGGSENADVGAAVVSRNEFGQRLGEAVGGDGIAWGLSPDQVFDVHGYPAEPPFDGSTQRVCSETAFLGHDLASFLWPGPLNLALSCDVTGGASGGGWTIHGNLLNSVTNYGYGDDRTTDFGAYFGRAVKALYEEASRVR